MIVLHAAFTDHRLMVWAEPDAGKTALLAAIAHLGTRLKFTRRDVHEAVAWLPTHDGRAAPSGALAGGGAIPDEDCYLAPHVVEALPLGARQAVDFLMACAGKRVAAPGVLIGDDVAYWTAAMRLSGGLALHGQYLPSLARENGGWAARWTPIPTGADAARLEALAKAMPPCARALTWETKDQEPETSAETVLLAFAGLILDDLVRSASAPQSRSRDSLHDLWLAALVSPDAGVAGDDSDLAALAARIEEWQRPVRVAALAPFRLSFRLHEPEDGADDWQVRYLLQGTKDPSLLVPAGDAWRRKCAAAFGSDPAALREHLLASLGQAAALCPRVEASLKRAAPEGYPLDATGAYQFLCETAGALEQSGFGVMLPSWWTRRGTKTRSAGSRAGEKPGGCLRRLIARGAGGVRLGSGAGR